MEDVMSSQEFVDTVQEDKGEPFQILARIVTGSHMLNHSTLSDECQEELEKLTTVLLDFEKRMNEIRSVESFEESVFLKKLEAIGLFKILLNNGNKDRNNKILTFLLKWLVPATSLQLFAVDKNQVVSIHQFGDLIDLAREQLYNIPAQAESND